MKARLFALVKAIAVALMGTRLRYVPGGRRAYELAYKLLAPRDATLVEFEGSRVYVDPQDIGVSLYLITEGTYEPRLTELLKRLIEPGMVVVDGGANVGCFTLLAARLVSEAGRVYAFEPEPKNFGLLRRSLDLNGYANVTATRSALSNRAGTEELFLDASNLGNPSFQAANVPDRAGAVEVRTVPLDAFLAEAGEPKVDLIKLDTQGAEGLVLEGAERTLAGEGLRVVMEFWPLGLRNMGTDPVELLDGLRGRGFEATRLDDRTGRLTPAEDTAAVVAECEGREGGRGFTTLVLRR
jgi:FkbM family methyltransferase